MAPTKPRPDCPQLLRQVRAGKQFTITNRGEAVADLVPCATGKPKDKVAAVEKFISFIRKNPVRRTGAIKALIEEGRMGTSFWTLR